METGFDSRAQRLGDPVICTQLYFCGGASDEQIERIMKQGFSKKGTHTVTYYCVTLRSPFVEQCHATRGFKIFPLVVIYSEVLKLFFSFSPPLAKTAWNYFALFGSYMIGRSNSFGHHLTKRLRKTSQLWFVYVHSLTFISDFTRGPYGKGLYFSAQACQAAAFSAVNLVSLSFPFLLSS